jgi:hypothetical protein
MRWLAAVGVLFVARSAQAAPICSTVAAFNAEAASKGIVARSGTLTYKVTGIDPNAGKGALGSLVDLRSKDATGNPCVGTYFKVYGPGPDFGKVKDELYNVCCKTCDTCTTERGGALGCETWAGEARSSLIFTAPTQTCDIEIRFGGTPNQHSYSVKCDDGKGDVGVGDNLYILEVNHVSLLEGYGGTGKIVGGKVLSDQFCYEPLSVAPPMDAGVDSAVPTSTTIPVNEDVTASNEAPTAVYPDVRDLSCGSDSEFFLKFVVPSTVGSVKRAILHLTNAGTTSAEGDGGALYRVESNAWSESTLTWSGKPARGARIGRVGPVTLNQEVTLDVTSVVTTAGTYSFVMAPEATDTNGTHFASKEAGKAPTLELEYSAPVAPSDAGVPMSDAAAVADSAAPPVNNNPGDPAPADAGSSDFSGGCQTSGGAASPFGLLAMLLLAVGRSRRIPGR